MWKKIGIGVAVLLIITAGAGWYLLSNLDSIIKAAISKYGSAATLTSVNVDGVKLSLTSGEGIVSGLIVGNPQGFTSPFAISVDSMTVQVDTSTLAGNGPIVIKTIYITQPHVTYEITAGASLMGVSTNSNLQAIQRNVQSTTAAPAAPPPSSTPARKEIIQDLYVTGGEISLDAAVLKGNGITVPLPPIHLTNIGASSGGVTPAQVAGQILSAVIAQANRVGAAALERQVRAMATGALQGVGGAPSNLGSQVKGLFGN
jgi:hypothetical protein